MWAVLALLPVLGFLVYNPEGRYEERYEESRLKPSDLAVPPPFPGRDPSTLTDLEVAHALASTWMRTHSPEKMRWSWEEAVALEGVFMYGRLAGEERAVRFVRRWIDAHREEALQTPLWSDAIVPFGLVLALQDALPRPGDRPLLDRAEAYLRREAPRTREHVPSHTGHLAGGWLPAQAWADSLFMCGVPLNRIFERTGQNWAWEESRRLALGMARSLRDPATGLYRHASFDLGPLQLVLPVEKCFWARANGWALYFLVDAQIARRSQGQPLDPELQFLLDSLARAFLKEQDQETGLWRTDLAGGGSEPVNPFETSASALAVAALRRGWRSGILADLDGVEGAIEVGLRGLRSRIDWRRGHPVLLGTSVGTHPGFRAYYRKIRTDENVGHGVGAMLLALTAGGRAFDPR